MQIIKDRQIITDSWTFIDNDSPLIESDQCVSLHRWQQDKQQILKCQGKTGLSIKPGDSIDEIADDLKHFELIALDFPVFTDGRGFSQAYWLRNRYHYPKEIRAIGHFIVDQVFYPSRVGVNAFQPANEKDLALALSSLNDFSVSYQK